MQQRLSMGEVDLSGWPFAQRVGFGSRHFGARDLLESVDRMARDPQSHSALGHREAREHRKGVKRAAFDRSGDVERKSAFWCNEEVVDREIVTASTAKSGHSPGVEDGYFGCAQRDLQQFGNAARTHHGLPVLAEQCAYQHHVGMLAPATEFPAT